jgi:hypothetical protein
LGARGSSLTRTCRRTRRSPRSTSQGMRTAPLTRSKR